MYFDLVGYFKQSSHEMAGSGQQIKVDRRQQWIAKQRFKYQQPIFEELSWHD